MVNSSNPTFILSLSLSSLLIMTILTYYSLPISLSQVALGAAVGSAMSLSIPISWIFPLLIILSWLVTPVVGVGIAFFLSCFARRFTKYVGGSLTLNIFYAYVTMISGLYASYVLGASTVGLIVGLSDEPQGQQLAIALFLTTATVVGMLLFSKGTTRSVAENIVGLSPSASFAAQMGGAITVHGFTQLGIPGLHIPSFRQRSLRGGCVTQGRCAKRACCKGDFVGVDSRSLTRRRPWLHSNRVHLTCPISMITCGKEINC